MSVDIYETLANSLTARPGSLPVINCPEFVELITELFSPAEAELAAKLPVGMMTPEKIAAYVNMPADKVLPLLESMADKGLVFHWIRRGKEEYKLMNILPGFFEFQFMKGEDSPRDRKLSKLFQNYFDKLAEYSECIPEPLKQIAPFSRVIPVDREIPAGTVVHPYETVSEYINQAEYISVANCYCRHHGELLGHPCKYPKEVCLAFGPNAEFIAKRGFGRLISKEEAFDILDKVEEQGLVHISSNTTKYIEFICNCCACHCGILQSLIKSNVPRMAAVSSFELVIDEEKCSGCESCTEVCPIEALTVDDDVVHVDVYRCIGCGVCNVACPEGALSMQRRPDAKEPPFDMKALNEHIMNSIQSSINKMNR